MRKSKLVYRAVSYTHLALYHVILLECALNCHTAISIADIISDNTVIAFDIDKTFGGIFTAHSRSVKCTVFHDRTNGILFDVNAVSYTHLDVYKRQI